MTNTEAPSVGKEYLWQFESSLMSACHDLHTKADVKNADEDREVLKTYILTLEKENAELRSQISQ